MEGSYGKVKKVGCFAIKETQLFDKDELNGNNVNEASLFSTLSSRPLRNLTKAYGVKLDKQSNKIYINMEAGDTSLYSYIKAKKGLKETELRAMLTVNQSIHHLA